MATGAAGENKQRVLEYFGSNFHPFYSKYLPKLKKVAGDEWAALCPFHSDKAPSFNVNAKTGLFYCHGCGAGGDVFSFYGRLHGLSNGDFPKVLEGIAGDFGITLEKLSKNGQHDPTHQDKRKNTHSGATDHVDHAEGAGHESKDATNVANDTTPKNNTEKSGNTGNTSNEVNNPTTESNTENTGNIGNIVATYDYHDAAGDLLFQVRRKEPKAFVQRRPDGKGGWTYNLKGVEPVLYHLPEVLAADEVLLPEGEKDADNLRALGFTATTCPMGAGKWRDNYTETLRGKDVILLPDNDEPGRKHALKVAGELYGKARSVKLIPLPGLPERGDVSDFIATFTDPEEAAERLSIMVDGAALWEPEPDPEPTEQPRFQFIHNGDLLNNLKPIEWQIGNTITANAFYYNFGDAGSFKTFVELDRLLHIAAGLPYHGRHVKQGTVFYVAGEGQQGLGRRIVAWHINKKTRAAEVPFFVSRVPTRLMDPEALGDVKAAIEAMAEKYGPPAVIHFDTLARNFGEGDENATKDMNRVISNLDEVLGAELCRGLTHHTGHGNKDRARGSIALHGAADTAFRVSQTTEAQIFVECVKMKDAPPAAPMLFEPREILLQIGDQRDKSYVLDLVAEGDEALALARPAKKPAAVSGAMNGALELLQKMAGANGSAPYKWWRQSCLKRELYTRTDAFNRAAAKMEQRGLVRFDAMRVNVSPIDENDTCEGT